MTKKTKVKYLRTRQVGPMGQDLANVFTCGSRDSDGRLHEHSSRDKAIRCPRRVEGVAK